jgi:hypothetical protein
VNVTAFPYDGFELNVSVADFADCFFLVCWLCIRSRFL